MKNLLGLEDAAYSGPNFTNNTPKFIKRGAVSRYSATDRNPSLSANHNIPNLAAQRRTDILAISIEHQLEEATGEREMMH